MVSDEILVVKDKILSSVGADCQKIILFGSHAYGTPRPDSDFDFFVVLKDGTERPLLVMQKIYRHLAQSPMRTPVDILANYESRFQYRSTQPTIERKIASDGVVLFDAGAA
jgi:predicted nucleotidyltransferase